MFRKYLLLPLVLVLILCLSACGLTVKEGDKEVTFPDSGLEEVIREAIGKPQGSIFTSELVEFTSLDALGKDIMYLTGLEHCTSLTELNLTGNRISDIAPLASLTNLSSLNLYDNQINDISPLASLTNLSSLHLSSNQIVR